MSEKMTRIRLPGQKDFTGLQSYGEVTSVEMIATTRRHAEYLRAEADAIDAASDADFQIDLVRGPYAQHHIREIQKSVRSDITPSHLKTERMEG